MKKRHFCLTTLVIIFNIYAINYSLIDHTALTNGGGLYWNKTQYSGVAGHYANPPDGFIVAEDQNGKNIIGYDVDADYEYLFVTGFRNHYFVVRNDYQIKKSGLVTAISVRRNHIKLTPERIKIKSILENSENTKQQACTFVTNNDLAEVQYSYNNSRVTDNSIGYISSVHGRWFYIKSLSKVDFNQLYNNKKVTLDCYEIESKYNQLFNGIKWTYRWFNDPDSPRSILINKSSS